MQQSEFNSLKTRALNSMHEEIHRVSFEKARRAINDLDRKIGA